MDLVCDVPLFEGLEVVVDLVCDVPLFDGLEVVLDVFLGFQGTVVLVIEYFSSQGPRPSSAMAGL